ncbi:hypothetical protein D9615_003770 [Tricholomella constricta]|uniref:Uncharacterized protein n=1 Tax=Tricholomella constricta TaxID=117010 RepID=A0A8H5M7Q7_9AGAR|nr:hypothetical protein D9615_003770 [Tricholomella constricta]
MLFYYSLAAAFLALMVAFFRYRATILPHIHVPDRMRTMFPRLGNYTPLSTFSQQVNAGMSSSAFDIEANLRDGDSRSGLDERGTQEVMEIMRQQRVNFDQARLIRHNRILAQNGIDPSGMPLDSKAVTRL